MKNQSVTKRKSNYNVLSISDRNSKGTLNYKNFRLIKTPTPKFPKMVEITRSVSSFKNLVGKRFTDTDKVMIYIDNLLSNRLIDKGRLQVSNQLNQIGFGELYSN